MKLHIRDITQGMKLRCIWYPSFAEACGKPYGIVPHHPRRGEIVTVDRVLRSAVSITNVQHRIALCEYYDSEGFLLSSFEPVENAASQPI